MRRRVLIAKNLLFEPYSACSLLVVTWMHQLETLLIVLHENQWEDTLFQGSPGLFSPSVKRRALGSRLGCGLLLLIMIASVRWMKKNFYYYWSWLLLHLVAPKRAVFFFFFLWGFILPRQFLHVGWRVFFFSAFASPVQTFIARWRRNKIVKNHITGASKKSLV